MTRLLRSLRSRHVESSSDETSRHASREFLAFIIIVTNTYNATYHSALYGVGDIIMDSAQGACVDMDLDGIFFIEVGLHSHATRLRSYSYPLCAICYAICYLIHEYEQCTLASYRRIIS